MRYEIWPSQQPRAFEDFGDCAGKSDFFATRAPRAERTLKEVAKGCVQAGVRSLSSLISPEHEWALLVAHRASTARPQGPPEAAPELRDETSKRRQRHADGFEHFEIWHVRTSK